jgi:putative DNA primase/helicase
MAFNHLGRYLKMSDPTQLFKAAIEAAGLIPPDVIHADGKLHRGKGKADSFWYALHTDGIPAGVFGCWRLGFSQTWSAKPENTMTAMEREAHRQRIKGMQAQREAEQVAQHQAAAVEAAKRWHDATACNEHPYLTTKGVQAHGVRVDDEGRLIVPMRDTAGNLHSLQTITRDGEKRFLYGGRVKGCYHAIGKSKAGKLILCEGFATGASIHEATGNGVAVAFNAGNLEAVALALRVKYPALKIIVAADDDHLTEGNPGTTKAKAAAQAVGGCMAVPKFPAGRPDKATDFNDLHKLSGLDAVRSCIEAAYATSDVANDWPEPTPLPDAMPPVQAFDADLLPEALRGWVMDIANRMQCPPDFTAVAALVAASSLIGARAVVQPKARDDWQVAPNMWGMVIGRPGVMKSPALSEALRPLNRLQQAELEKCQVAHDEWELDCKVAEMTKDANIKKAKGLAEKNPAAARALLGPIDTPDEPIARRYIVNDATVEKLGELLQQNPWGTLSYRDELYGLLTGLDKQGQEGSRAFYLQAYDGNQGYTFDRIQRGTVHIPRVCLAMLGGIQPGRIQEYVRGAVAGGSADDGLLQRFGLTVWPDIKGEYVLIDRWPDTPAKQAAWEVFKGLAELEPANDTDPHVWHFDDAAQALFVEWLVPFETEIRGDDIHPAMVAHLSKYRKLIPALALVFALIDTPDSDYLIGEQALIRALAWGDYLRTHAERLYAAAVNPEAEAAALLLSNIKRGKLTDRDGVMLESFTPRLIAQKGWAGLGTPEAVRKAAEFLADFDWLKRVIQPSTDVMGRGRPSECFAIHPAALTGRATT